MPQSGQWKDFTVRWSSKDGSTHEEKAYLTVDTSFPPNQIVVVNSLHLVLAEQPGPDCDYDKLRKDAIAKWITINKPSNPPTDEVAI